jgi:hypothetical protein
MVAAKYEEIYPPQVKDYVYITDRAYTKCEILGMEFNILNTLSFDVTFPTSFRFLERYSRCLGNGEADLTLFSLAQYLIELSMLDVRMLIYKPSVMAASGLCLAHKII